MEVDEYLRTSNPDVYAAGDVAFPQKFTHAAIATARLGVANALEGATPGKRTVIPHCTYTDPEMAEVGLIPRQAHDQGVPIDVYRLELDKVERAFIDGEEEGFAAIYTHRSGGEIVGATLVAAHAGEMISELTAAISNQVPLEAVAETIHCYPTQAEAFQRIALGYAETRKVAAARAAGWIRAGGGSAEAEGPTEGRGPLIRILVGPPGLAPVNRGSYRKSLSSFAELALERNPINLYRIRRR